jgi:hypothetical protein
LVPDRVDNAWEFVGRVRRETLGSRRGLRSRALKREVDARAREGVEVVLTVVVREISEKRGSSA